MTRADSDQKQTANDAVEKRVDAMMDPRAEQSEKPSNPDLPPLDIFATPTGAPPLIDDSLKIAEIAKEPASASDAPVEAAQPEPIVTESSEKADDIEIKPLQIDDPRSNEAIDDIVAQEADAVLAAEDAHIADDAQTVAEQTEEPTTKGHPIFWFVIFMLAVVCIIAAVLVTNPNVSLPFSA